MTVFKIRYQTIEFDDFDIHLRTLKDKNQFSDPLGEAGALGISSAQWSLFGVVWESAEVLAREMQHFEIEGKRILEVGCGIGLTSILLNARHADITATDYHPEVGAFLTENAKLNQGSRIPFLRTSWAEPSDGLGLYDVIVGSDLLYEKEHVLLLSQFIHRHAKPQCDIILVDPGRGHHSLFSRAMTALGYAHSQYKPNQKAYENKPFKGQVLKYSRP
ncbi:MAG TPA: methyltransferase domain-containing protein [Marinagarivorans sp.]